MEDNSSQTFQETRRPYYPLQSKGHIEHFHRQLKSFLLCQSGSWYDALPAPEKFYKILLIGEPTHIYVNRLKPAYICRDDIEHLKSYPTGNNLCHVTSADINPDPLIKIQKSKKSTL